jgi:hypothetical protein
MENNIQDGIYASETENDVYEVRDGVCKFYGFTVYGGMAVFSPAEIPCFEDRSAILFGSKQAMVEYFEEKGYELFSD